MSDVTELSAHDEDAEIAADFIEAVLDVLDLPGGIDIAIDGDDIRININGTESDILIGRNETVTMALQDIVRAVIHTQQGRHSHIMLDVDECMAKQLERNKNACRDAIEKARKTGRSVHLPEMNPYHRKLIHDMIAETDDMESYSVGGKQSRHVVVKPLDE